jgi:phosphoserine phosphatase
LNDFLYYGKKYFDEYLNKRFIYYTHDLLFYLKNKGIEVILLSTAVDPVVQPLAEYFSIPYTCISACNNENNYIDVSQIKDFKIRFISKYEADTMMVIADSKHDLEILKYSRYPVIVAEKRKKWMHQIQGKLVINNHLEAI